MNPITTQIISAQDAYIQTVKNWDDVDTTQVLLTAGQMIRKAIEAGQSVTSVHNIEDIRVAEKAAIELETLGYNAITIASGKVVQPDGSFKPLFGVVIDFKYLPTNTRDKFTV